MSLTYKAEAQYQYIDTARTYGEQVVIPWAYQSCFRGSFPCSQVQGGSQSAQNYYNQYQNYQNNGRLDYGRANYPAYYNQNNRNYGKGRTTSGW